MNTGALREPPGRASLWLAAGRLVSRAGQLEILLYLVLGLTPLLWFPHGQLITGGDIDYPLDPIGRLHERVFAWNILFLGGTDRSLDVSTLFFSAIEALGFWLTHNLVASEMFSFVFWFAAAGISAAIFFAISFPGRRALRIAGTVFYMFNFYQFYNWEIARIGEISATIEMPLFLAAIAGRASGLLTLRHAALLAAVACVVGMGIGVQPPALFAMLIVLASYWAFELAAALFDRDGAAIRRLIVAGAILPLVFVAVNATWILPEINFIVAAGYVDSGHGIAVFEVNKLLEWTSRNTSILNNFEIAGRTIFTDIWGGEPYLPVLAAALATPWYRALGLFLPVLAFAPLFWERARRIWYFAALALGTIFLSKGIHPPFGEVYSYLLTHVPGFWVLRAPWEKFALATSFAYAVLIGTSAHGIYRWLAIRRPRSSLTAGLAVATLCAAIIAFHYPLVIGASFPEAHGHPTYPGFHQTIPAYTLDAAAWLRSLPGETRVLTMPDNHVSIYRWGYAAPLDFTVRLFDKAVIDRQYGEGTAPPHPSDQAYGELAAAIYDGDGPTAEQLLHYFNVGYILQRNDIQFDFYGGHDSPKFLADRLRRIRGLHLVRRFGAWDFYRFDRDLPHIYSASRVVVTEDRLSSFGRDLFPLRDDTAVVVSGLEVGGIHSAPDDIGSDVPVSLPHPLHDIDEIARDHAVAELYFPVDKIASVSARFFPGAKTVVNNRPDDPTKTLFANPVAGYRFLNGSRTWTAVDSTLVYVETGDQSVVVTDLRDNGTAIKDVVGIVWETGWAGFVTHPLQFPVTIPAHERAIVQINHRIKGEVTLVGVGRSWTVAVEEPGTRRPFAGFRTRSGLTGDAVTTATARFIPGEARVLGAANAANPALFAPPGFSAFGGAREWSATNATVVAFTTGERPLRIDGLLDNGLTVTDLVGLAWDDGWIGFGSRPIVLPLVIPPHRRVIAQINHEVIGEVTVVADTGGVVIPVRSALGATFVAAPPSPSFVSLYVPKTDTFTLALCSLVDLPARPAALIDGHALPFLAESRSGSCQEYRYGPIRLVAGSHYGGFPNIGGKLSGVVALRSTAPVRDPPGVTYERETPVQLFVRVSAASASHLLIFGDNYNAGWRLYKGHLSFWQLVFARSPGLRPVLLNGYANGWLLADRAASEYTLFFWPQILLAAGFAIACGGFALVVILALRPEVLAVLRRTRPAEATL